MSTFASSAYDSESYAASRPSYPRLLYDVVLQFHREGPAPETAAKWERAVDLGCGTGGCCRGISRFQRVLAIDPSANMVDVAREHVPDEYRTRVEFRQSAAEELSFIEDGTIDLVIAAQSAHWFDWTRAWPEFQRILKPGGTFAFWGYSDIRITRYPELTPLISEYSHGNDPATSLGPHWEPGRQILDGHFLAIDAPAAGWADLTRVFYTGPHYAGLPTPPRDVILKRTMTWGGGFAGYLRTLSALHRYHIAFPEDRQRADGDIAERFRRALMNATGLPEGADADATLVEVEWPLALVMVRKM
ncbi:S-adenosyl-L-methionine-dependent methyltransferase [Mycena rosella]|uniref:S-adenosyl-L-methionine-dependent methyltransferase n=1 Tax=Mycena rosella TaxID=1033263 RepID=A0AAD7DP44_MYCRO|nr:S-adenosyl-L-methionine-dependent methyltransferase [Mycena rosella]